MSSEFLRLHQSGTFLLVNVNDAGSGLVAQAAGAQALGTTSAGLAWSLGRPDFENAVSRDDVLRHVSSICDVVRVPLSVDAENGWRHEPEGVAESIRLLADAGAAGASIEDWSGDADRGMYEHGLAVERVQAAVEAARSLPEPFVVCARAEAFIHDSPHPMDEALGRLQAFAAVGADCLYAPGPPDRARLQRLVAEAGGPVNALLPLGSEMTVAELAEIGARRVSVGGSLYRGLLTMVRDVVRRALDAGDVSAVEPILSAAEIEALLPGRSG